MPAFAAHRSASPAQAAASEQTGSPRRSTTTAVVPGGGPKATEQVAGSAALTVEPSHAGTSPQPPGSRATPAGRTSTVVTRTVTPSGRSCGVHSTQPRPSVTVATPSPPGRLTRRTLPPPPPPWEPGSSASGSAGVPGACVVACVGTGPGESPAVGAPPQPTTVRATASSTDASRARLPRITRPQRRASPRTVAGRTHATPAGGARLERGRPAAHSPEYECFPSTNRLTTVKFASTAA